MKTFCTVMNNAIDAYIADLSSTIAQPMATHTDNAETQFKAILDALAAIYQHRINLLAGFVGWCVGKGNFQTPTRTRAHARVFVRKPMPTRALKAVLCAYQPLIAGVWDWIALTATRKRGYPENGDRCKKPIDTNHQHQHNANTAFNHAVGFSSPRQRGKQPPLSNARYFYACNPLTTFSNGKQGREALRLLVHVASLLTRLLFPACTFSSVCAGLKNQREKVTTIMTKIRKGYARPLFSHPLRSFSTLSDAVRFIDRLTESNTGNYRFNIQQSFEHSGSRWTVCRIVSGGVQ